MPTLLGTAKRLLVGRPMQSDRLSHTLLPKRIALPVFASDALSSVAYATEEILLVLSAGGIALIGYTPWIAAAVALLMLVVVASYRQNVHAYPSGGGDYEVTTTNLGPKVGLTVASALMVDYTLTVAVSVSSGVANLASAFPVLDSRVTVIAVVVVIVIAVMNLRGVRESGTAFAIPSYLFIGVVGLLIAWGATRLGLGAHLRAESASYRVRSIRSYSGAMLIFLLLRAFSSGCTALTGVEAISNGVPAFRPPKSRNAATTLALLGLIAVSMFGGITALALISHVHACLPGDCTGVPPGQPLRTVVAQVGRAVFGNSSPLFYLLQFVTALILVLAANTAFNGFPVLASILSRDGYLPRQLHTRGDRLAFSNGILLLSGFAILLIVIFQASPTRLIQLYIIGVFVSFVSSQTGMIRHWNRHLRTETDPRVRRHMQRTRVINTIGACFTGVVLVIVLVSKFASGAWIVVVAMPVIWLTMQGIHRHYEQLASELAPPAGTTLTLPARNRAIVLVSRLHRPTLRALAYARAARPTYLEAVTVDVDQAETARLQEQWEDSDLPVPLTVVASPYRKITSPVVDYVKGLSRQSPHDIVTLYVPEYVLGHWWQQLLHNQSALRIKTRLLLQPGVVVASVPYQLGPAARPEPGEGAAPALPPPAAPARPPGPAAPGSPGSPAARPSLAALTVPSASAAPTRGADGPEPPAPGLTTDADVLQAAELRAELIGVSATAIANCHDHELVDVAGTLRAVTLKPRGASLTLQAEMWDGTGTVTLVWLGRRAIRGIRPGRRLLVHGRIAVINNQRMIYNPSYQLRAGPGPADSG